MWPVSLFLSSKGNFLKPWSNSNSITCIISSIIIVSSSQQIFFFFWGGGGGGGGTDNYDLKWKLVPQAYIQSASRYMYIPRHLVQSDGARPQWRGLRSARFSSVSTVVTGRPTSRVCWWWCYPWPAVSDRCQFPQSALQPSSPSGSWTSHATHCTSETQDVYETLIPQVTTKSKWP